MTRQLVILGHRGNNCFKVWPDFIFSILSIPCYMECTRCHLITSIPFLKEKDTEPVFQRYQQFEGLLSNFLRRLGSFKDLTCVFAVLINFKCSFGRPTKGLNRLHRTSAIFKTISVKLFPNETQQEPVFIWTHILGKMLNFCSHVNCSCSQNKLYVPFTTVFIKHRLKNIGVLALATVSFWKRGG